jgi:hypothetical protein
LRRGYGIRRQLDAVVRSIAVESGRARLKARTGDGDGDASYRHRIGRYRGDHRTIVEQIDIGGGRRLSVGGTGNHDSHRILRGHRRGRRVKTGR